MSEMSSCVKRCCVNGCNKSTRSHPYHSFFRFPVEKARYEKWLEAIGRLDILEKGFKLSSYRICESHFPRGSISTYVNHDVNPKNSKILNRLAKNAIPTLNVNLPVNTRGGPSGVANDCRQNTSYFMVTPRRAELVTCGVEIVSIPPDPLFKYNNLSVSATKTVNCLEYNELTLLENGIDKSAANSEDCVHIPNIKKKTIEEITDSNLRKNHSEDSVFIKNSKTKKVEIVSDSDLRKKLRKLLTESLLENDKSAENSEDCLNISDIKKEKNEDIDSQLSSSQAGIITTDSGVFRLLPVEAVSSMKRENCSDDVQINSQEDEKLHKDSGDKDCVYISNFNEDHTYSQPSSSKPSPSLKINLPLSIPIVGIKHDPPLKIRETYMTEEYDDYCSTNNASKPLVNLNIRPVLNNMLEVSPNLLKRNENVVKTNNDDNALLGGSTDTICVKSENIEDLLDISDTQLI